jgi:drug/metabolite transporter (DMT)-like permease
MFDVTPQKGNKPASLVLTLVALAMTPVHSIVAAMSRADAAVFVALAIGCSLFFYAWNPSLARGNSKVPTRTLVLVVMTAVLSPLLYIAGWESGARYQGRDNVTMWCWISVVFALTCLASTLAARKKPSFAAALFAQTTLFLWLLTVAFPWLGEHP